MEGVAKKIVVVEGRGSAVGGLELVVAGRGLWGFVGYRMGGEWSLESRLLTSS